MDSLDFNLHQAILKSLATSFAGSDAKSAKAAATGKAAATNIGDSSDALQSSYEDILDTFDLSPDLLEERDNWTYSDANAVIAFAEYALESAKASMAMKTQLEIQYPQSIKDDCIERLRKCSAHVKLALERLHVIKVDRCLGGQGIGAKWVTADQLAFALAAAGISLAEALEDDSLIQTILKTYKLLKEEIEETEVSHVVEHILPCLHGLYRAITTVSTVWTATAVDHIPSVLEPLSPAALSTISSISRGSFIHSSNDGRFVLSVLARYEMSGSPFSTNFVTKCDAEICRAILAGTVSAAKLTPNENWQQLISGTIKPNSTVRLDTTQLSYITKYAKETLAASLEALRDLEEEQDSVLEGTDLYELQTVSNCLQIATAACLAHVHDTQHIATLETILSDASPIYDSEIQVTALECVQALVHSYADLAEPMLSVLRRFVTSPLPILSSHDNHPSPVLDKAAEALATCIGRLNQEDMTLSTIYSLLNYLPSAKADHGTSIVQSALPTQDGSRLHPSFANRTLDERHAISSNTLFVVTKLATRFENQEVIKLALSMLLQRIRNADVISERSALMCVAELAPVAGKDEFTEAAIAFAEFARHIPRPDSEGQSGIILGASLKFASNLEDKPEYAIVFLRELLVLFVDQSSPARHGMHKDGHIRDKITSVTPADRASVLPRLLDTLSIIETLLASPKVRLPRESSDEEIVVLFRNLWFISTVLGLTMHKTSDAEEHKVILRSIAFKTPCLLQYTQGNYVETELEYNPFIRKEHGQSSEALRDELDSIVRQHQSINARSLSYPQVVFLLAVVKLEGMRAELGDPSVMPQYFHNEGVNRGPLIGPLNDISEKVTESFVVSFDHKVRRHAVKRSIAQLLISMILECCTTSPRARKAALKSLDTIFAAFPVLLCDSALLVTMLECLTILRNACESEMDDEYNATFEFESKRANITLTLPDDYAARNEILNTFHQYVRSWLSAALAASPLEMVGLLQDYLDTDTTTELADSSGMGKSVALDIAKMMPSSVRQAEYPSYGGWKADTASLFSSAFGTRHTYGSEAKTVVGLSRADGSVDKLHVQALKKQLRDISESLRHRTSKLSIDELRPILYRAAAVVLAKKEIDYGLIREIVFIPVHAINPPAMHLGVEVWAWLVDRRADVEAKLMVDVHLAWSWSIRRRRGMFSVLLKAEDPINSKTEFAPTDVAAMKKANRTVRHILAPHRYLIEFLSSRFQAYRYRDRYLVLGCMRTVIRACERCRTWGKHPLVRELRMKILTLGMSILNSTHLEQTLESNFRDRLYRAALSWFEEVPSWSYGADRLQLREDIKAMQRLILVIKVDHRYPSAVLSSRPGATRHQPPGPAALTPHHQDLRRLLLLHLESEIQRLAVWSNPLEELKRGQDPSSDLVRSLTPAIWTQCVRTAWNHSPRLAVLMVERFKDPSVKEEVVRLIRQDPARAADVPEALEHFLGSHVAAKSRQQLKHLAHWAPVSPVAALRYFLPAFNTEPMIVQYAMRTLEQHPIDLVFFYIPQVVQALRTDPLSKHLPSPDRNFADDNISDYMERFIFETSKISQLFCHQMIWNMKANFYRDDLAEQADPDKETFERMVDLIVSSLSGDAKAFYEKEFGFFNEVTSISRKLMPFVKKTKPEKKAKIDEEMAKIKVEEGVYLPSHPEGRVVDIDRHSGRPLQSHAKTPFMATFKVTREVEEDYSEVAIEEAGGEHTRDGGKDGGANEGFPSLQGGESGQPRKRTIETKLSAIFKVGDDCRQDVLALQVIAQFKNMFNVYGLDLQLQPYKVLATGPGTGIIDVVPNATSRDEMGRAKINDLTEFFLFQFGPAEGIAFQRARSNFIQSMAAYSVLCYILQIKDRHNGNIMIDGEGRITHIDFGFLFDIGPGGIKFEPNSFKLTHEMITLMGGKNSQGYRQFRELTVKAFLSCRPYAEDVVSTCSLMMPTQLPSFKGEGTIIRLRDRFKPELTEREAARYMIGVIDNACENSMSIVYDQFQYYQNRIPYAS